MSTPHPEWSYRPRAAAAAAPAAAAAAPAPVAAAAAAAAAPPPAKPSAPATPPAALAPPPRPRPLVLEPFRPLGQSLEWRVGSTYWARRGARAFTSNEVPHFVTNDGVRAARAAEVLFATCEAAERAGTLAAEVRVLEVGIGLGLHAKLFLDHFRALCIDAQRDYYGRLVYLATDYSAKMVTDARSRGVLDEHEGRVRFARLDVLQPERLLDDEGRPAGEVSGLYAVFANYVLDTLPMTQLVRSESRWLELMVESRIDDVAQLEARGVRVEELQAEIRGDGGHDKLQSVFDLVRVTRAYCSTEIAAQPFAAHLVGYAERLGDGALAINHAHGAVKALLALLGVLRSDGFVLVNDYACAPPDWAIDAQRHQRYAGSRSAGLDFALLAHAVAGERPDATVVVPDGDEEAPLRARLLTVNRNPAAEAAFRERYAKATLGRIDALAVEARAARGRGDAAAAVERYREALALCPVNWLLYTELSSVATYDLRDRRLGIELAQKAAKLNGGSSPIVWNQLGDAFYEAGMAHEALSAYRCALRCDADDARAHLGVAWCAADAQRFDEAIAELAQGLVADRGRQYRAILLDKLQHTLAARDAATAAR